MTIGVLVAIAVISVLAIGVETNRRNTLDLLNDKATLIVQTIDQDVASHLDPAEDQLTFLASRLADMINPLDKQRVSDLLLGALAATPEISFLGFWDSDLFRVAFADYGDDPTLQPELLAQLHQTDPQTIEADAEVRDSEGAFWGEIVFTDGSSFINLRQPVRRGDEYLGFLVAAVSVPELSEIVTRIGDRFDATAFILYGRDGVLAHPNLISPHPDLSPDNPVVARNRVGDLVLAGLWEGEEVPGFEKSAEEGVKVDLVTVGSTETVVLYRWINRYGEPWALGAYFAAEDLSQELLRLRNSILAGFAVLLVAIALAILMGRWLAAPIRRAAAGAALIGKLDLVHVEPLKRSLIKELNEQAQAFNAMLLALRWFETYVPRTLVTRLIRRGARDPGSVERELTVMFTDIGGFTARAERMSARETAEFLNHHFAILASCIEAEGGTIDKYIGDALMAFWGAPDHQTDHAMRACRAAQAIERALESDNQARRASGQDPVQIRIGIHTGAMIVGNIGAPGRMNYTVVGDSVNVAQRLESLGQQFGEESSTVTLISGMTAAHLDPDIALSPAGSFEVKGRADPIEVFQLRS
ncbi:MAG: adenylate/guanylate cyclase domain-containing protein [Pseudomonadota bacterium]